MCDNGPCEKVKLDYEICERLRNENPQQFHTLVRMHLSFELDMNTDEYEAVYCEKGKLKKWNRFHKKAKGCASVKSGSPPDVRGLTRDGMVQAQKLIDFLMEDQNIIQEGIFRKTGSLSRQNDLKSQMSLRAPLNLHNGNYNVHDCASVLKYFLSELSEPLLTDAYYPVHCQLAEIYNNEDTSTSGTREPRLLNAIQLLILLLPEDNRILFQEIIDMLYKTAEYECKNKMSADSLSTIFTPHLICPRKLAPELLHSSAQAMCGIVSFMISKGNSIFEIPPRLSTDIHVYFEQKSTKSMTLDESITNTVYTFCDREKTKEAHDAHPTDQALAQLYAHIQTLPESSKKRKLIKQFNKENGHGTPLQYLLLNRMKTAGSTTTSALKNTKSLGDSIKKHIFYKNLLSRTPKKPSTQSPFLFTNSPGGNSLNNSGSTFNTPVRGLSTQPKMRVLFQSPLTISSNNSLNDIEMATCTNAKLSSSSSNRTIIDHCKNSNKTKGDTCDNDNNIIDDNYEDDLDDNDFDDDENDDHFSDSSGSPLIFASDKKLKSHYKSEPNLSHIDSPATQTTPHVKNFANKLIKGVSMSNLKLSIFSSGNNGGGGGGDHNKMGGKHRGFIGKRRKSFHINAATTSSAVPKLQDPSQCVTNGDDNGENYGQNVHMHLGAHDFCGDDDEDDWELNGDYFMGTPVTHFIGRNSMSPITKSTQRMPKAMQESIMTPRSRKPVMLLGTNLNSSDTNQSNYYKSCSSLNEADEDLLITVSQVQPTVTMPLQRAKSLDNLQTNQIGTNEGGGCGDESGERLTKSDKSFSSSNPESLTSEFRDYLFSRSVLTASPADLSFSSQPDDFGDDDSDDTTDIRNLSETDMSESLLYCLDGNKPADDISMRWDDNQDHHPYNNNSGRCSSNVNVRKRPSDVATVEMNRDEENKENVQIKKMVLKNNIELDETSL